MWSAKEHLPKKQLLKKTFKPTMENPPKDRIKPALGNPIDTLVVSVKYCTKVFGNNIGILTLCLTFLKFMVIIS